MMKRALLIITLIAGTAGSSLPAAALTPAEAVAAEIALREALKLGDYAKIYWIIKPQAKDGDPSAQYLLARLYMNGKGVKQDYSQASYWFQQSAMQGFAPAQRYLSAMCSRKPQFCQ